MRRIWAVWILLLILWGICTLGLWGTFRMTGQITASLEQVEDSLHRENLEEALQWSEKAQDDWPGSYRILCLFLSHDRLANIGKELDALTVYLEQGDAVQAAAQCAQVKDSLHLLRENEVPTPENIL